MSKNKKARRLKKEFNYYHSKVEQMENERDEDRSWETKALIKRHKKMKLHIKDQLEVLDKN
tara:strand:+ start:332 stop:514 length:183 start_codon:yes stop_codon:yes gene_type:complete